MRRYTVHAGDCRDVLRDYPADHFDSIVSDPPYGLSFMGKGWDRGVPGEEFWREALRVAKPGAHLLAFGGSRTFHRLTVAIEDAGWEVRDVVCWLYGQGLSEIAECWLQVRRSYATIRPCKPTDDRTQPVSSARRRCTVDQPNCDRARAGTAPARVATRRIQTLASAARTRRCRGH